MLSKVKLSCTLLYFVHVQNVAWTLSLSNVVKTFANICITLFKLLDDVVRRPGKGGATNLKVGGQCIEERQDYTVKTLKL